MATTFVGVEVGGSRVHPKYAAVVLRRRRGAMELQHWAAVVPGDEELLGYLAAQAGTSGVIAIHGRGVDTDGAILKRIWRVLDYKLLFAIAPRHRTRALVRVDPHEVQRAFAGGKAPTVALLDQVRHLVPAVDYAPLIGQLDALPPDGPSRRRAQPAVRAALSAYAALWCWWHGPAGYDVLGANADDYRLAPRTMDFETDAERKPF